MTKELDSDFQSCLKWHKIQAFADGPRVADKELVRAAKDLGVARDGLARGDCEWATAQAYYAAFLAGRCMLLARGIERAAAMPACGPRCARYLCQLAKYLPA